MEGSLPQNRIFPHWWNPSAVMPASIGRSKNCQRSRRGRSGASRQPCCRIDCCGPSRMAVNPDAKKRLALRPVLPRAERGVADLRFPSVGIAPADDNQDGGFLEFDADMPRYAILPFRGPEPV